MCQVICKINLLSIIKIQSKIMKIQNFTALRTKEYMNESHNEYSNKNTRSTMDFHKKSTKFFEESTFNQNHTLSGTKKS